MNRGHSFGCRSCRRLADSISLAWIPNGPRTCSSTDADSVSSTAVENLVRSAGLSNRLALEYLSQIVISILSYNSLDAHGSLNRR